jgi:hypothetical protein
MGKKKNPKKDEQMRERKNGPFVLPAFFIPNLLSALEKKSKHNRSRSTRA